MRVALVPVRSHPPLITLRTEGFSQRGHPELSLTVREDRVPPQIVHWLADTLSIPVLEGGERWQDGETVRVGWSSVRMRAEGELLRVEVWDFARRAFVPEVTSLLEALGSMNDLLERTALLPYARYPHGDDLASWSGGVVGFGSREEPERPHSGWHFDGEEQRPLWEVVAALPSLLPALALPPGTSIQLAAGRLVTVLAPDGTATDLG